MAQRKLAVGAAGSLVLAVALFCAVTHNRAQGGAKETEVAKPASATNARAIDAPQVTPVEKSGWQRADTNSASVSFASLYSQAESGDIVAQRELAGIYERCAFYSQSPSTFNETVRSLARDRGAEAGAYDEILVRYKATCSAVDGGQRIPSEAYKLWYEQAAKGGDTVSRMRLAASNSATLTDRDFQGLARDAANTADPEAIFALGNLLSLAPESADLGDFREISKGPYMALAWGIAACRQGADCRPGSPRMDEICIAAGVCGPLDFEEGVRHDLVPQGQVAILEKNIRDIQGVLGRN